MAQLQSTPVIRASAAVSPFRFVDIDTTDNTGSMSALGGLAIGVSDGSAIEFDDADHANTGDVIRIQSGEVVKVEVDSGGVTAGQAVSSAANGLARAWATTHVVLGRALETGTDGQVVRILFRPDQAGTT